MLTIKKLYYSIIPYIMHICQAINWYIQPIRVQHQIQNLGEKIPLKRVPVAGYL